MNVKIEFESQGGSPMKLYNNNSRYVSYYFATNKQKKEGKEDRTYVASKFRHPDVHSKRIVEIGKVIDNLLRIGSVNVRSHMIELFPPQKKINNAKRTIE